MTPTRRCPLISGFPKNVSLSSVIDGNEAQSSFGDLDFTDGGIEGPLGFRLSRKCVKALCNGSRVSLVLDLKPAVEEAELSARRHSGRSASCTASE